MEIEVTKEGKGKFIPFGSTVKLYYTCKLPDGTVIDSNVGKDPFVFKAGYKHVIRCLDEAVLKLQRGSEANLVCPPEYAYGSWGAKGVIEPN